MSRDALVRRRILAKAILVKRCTKPRLLQGSDGRKAETAAVRGACPSRNTVLYVCYASHFRAIVNGIEDLGYTGVVGWPFLTDIRNP